LSEKYAELCEEAVALREKNQNLIDENSQLKERISVLEADLKKTQKELTEANDLLIEMRIELNNWKMDVIGFRDEIRQAESAQLEALLKILKILGGEVTVESVPGEDKGSTAVSSVESAQQKSENTSNRGEPNE
jgi:chromosome segregation ATPase